MTIAEKLSDLKSSGRKALAMFSTLGDPDWNTSLKIFSQLGAWGADILEFGIPYSDPLMDGPVLQRAYHRALNRGFRLKDIPNFVEQVRRKSDAPGLIMSCFNPIYKYGVRRFFQDVSSAGVDSMLITDLPPEEWGESLDLARSFGLGTIFLVTPTTSIARMEWINQISRPFVYCVTRTGVTGTSHELPDALTQLIAFVRGAVTRPVLLGFGISNARQARLTAGLADGIIIGSALVECIERNLDSDERMLNAASGFVRGVREAMDNTLE